MGSTARRILGVDPGTKVVGYCLLDSAGPGQFSYVECGVLRSNERSAGARIFEIATELSELICEAKPQHLAIESAFHGLNAHSALALGESRGAYKLVAAQQGLEIFEYAPTKIKRAVTGQGRASKEQIQRRVAALCQLSSVPRHDAADAVAIAICHVQLGLTLQGQVLSPNR